METENLTSSYLQLRYFIASLRNAQNNDNEQFNAILFKEFKENESDITNELNQLSKDILKNAFFVNAFAEYGINSNNGFFSEITSKIKHRILPLSLPKEELCHFIENIFVERKDYIWLNKININNWKLIINSIENSDSNLKQKLQLQICNSLSILCNRLTTLGIDSSLSIKFPAIDDLGSPFFNLSNQLDKAINFSSQSDFLTVDQITVNQINSSINEIENLFIAIRTDIKESGTSLHLTYLLKRAQQHIERINILTQLLFCKTNEENTRNISNLITQLVEAEKVKNSISQFFRTHTQILAFRIVSHTSRKGEDYIGFNKQENKSLFKSAMGGGLVVVILVYLKHFIHELHLSLFFEGILFGLNYGLGFVAMHLLHFTLATKQPALTASFIAESIEHNDGTPNKSRITFNQIIKSQWISLLGNLIVVVPICFIISYTFNELCKNAIFNDEVAYNAMKNNHLFYSLSLFYAVITGIILSFSSIVAGYIDNKVIYSQIGIRVENHPKLKRKYAPEKRKLISSFIEKNLGSISGNLFLGFSLGMAGNLGEFIGISYDIRHITISAGNFSIALVNMHSQDLILILTVFATVVLIGFINISVSFLISFILACRSRGLSWKQSIKQLFKAI